MIVKKLFGEVIDCKYEEIQWSQRFLERSLIAHNKYVLLITKKLKFSIANEIELFVPWCNEFEDVDGSVQKVAPRLSADSDLSHYGQKKLEDWFLKVDWYESIIYFYEIVFL